MSMRSYYFKMLFYYVSSTGDNGDAYGFIRDVRGFKSTDVVNHLYTLEFKELYSRGEYNLKEVVSVFCGLTGIEYKQNRFCRRRCASGNKFYYYNCYELWLEDIERLKGYSRGEFNRVVRKVRKVVREGFKTSGDLISLSYAAFPRETEYFCVLDNRDSLKVKNLDEPFLFYTPMELKEVLEGVGKIEIIGGGWFK